MKWLRADLHIHTGLSPCAGREMTPPAIVEAARANGLALIAICDHNSAGNTAAVIEAAGDDPVVLPGIEVMTAEEVHVLGIFAEVESAAAVALDVMRTLPQLKPEYLEKFGLQSLLDAKGRVVGCETRMLAMAFARDLNETVRLIHERGGLCVAAHVDRPSFSVTSQLGMFPAEAGFDAVEVSPNARTRAQAAAYEGWGLPMIRSSDSHFLADIGSVYTQLRVREAGFRELAAALKASDCRRKVYDA